MLMHTLNFRIILTKTLLLNTRRHGLVHPMSRLLSLSLLRLPCSQLKPNLHPMFLQVRFTPRQSRSRLPCKRRRAIHLIPLRGRDAPTWTRLSLLYMRRHQIHLRLLCYQNILSRAHPRLLYRQYMRQRPTCLRLLRYRYPPAHSRFLYHRQLTQIRTASSSSGCTQVSLRLIRPMFSHTCPIFPLKFAHHCKFCVTPRIRTMFQWLESKYFVI